MPKKTKTYTVWVPFHTGISVAVKATSPDEAIELAKDRIQNDTLDADMHNQVIDNLQGAGSYEVLE